MGKFILVVLVTLIVLVIAGAGILMFWDIPAPTARVEHPISDARLPR